jgi:CDP-paratose 2-epimerase
VFTSTNKVYGALEDVELRAEDSRYAPVSPELCARGIGEWRQLDFHSPYGCSKGAADQYVLDYARSFGLPATVFRMSCIYGPRQFGTEDQGWVAHFLIRALSGQGITLYGDGKQVRDVLFIDDLVNAFLLARDNIDRIAGTAFNIGGGVENVTSLLELLDCIEQLTGRKPPIERENWRVGDQRYYVSDFTRFQERTGWRPQVSFPVGLERLHAWLLQERFRSDSSASKALRLPAAALETDAP